MAKINVTYRPGDGDPVTTNWRGTTFVKDKPVELDDDVPAEKELIEAAKTNPSFDVGDVSKAEERAKAARAADVAKAENEIARIKNEHEALELRQENETAALEAQHQRERDEFLNINEPIMIAQHRVLRGSDGSDDNQPVDTAHDPLKTDPAADAAKPDALPTAEPQQADPEPEPTKLQEQPPEPPAEPQVEDTGKSS